VRTILFKILCIFCGETAATMLMFWTLIIAFYAVTGFYDSPLWIILPQVFLIEISWKINRFYKSALTEWRQISVRSRSRRMSTPPSRISLQHGLITGCSSWARRLRI